MTGIRATGRGPHITSIVPDHAPINAFDPRARLIGSSLCVLIVLTFVWLVLR
jgi:hypothetical protein